MLHTRNREREKKNGKDSCVFPGGKRNVPVEKNAKRLEAGFSFSSISKGSNPDTSQNRTNQL